MSKKHKKGLQSFELRWKSLIAISTITGCFSISAFASLVEIPIRVSSFAIGLKICLIKAAVKKCKSIITKKG